MGKVHRQVNHHAQQVMKHEIKKLQQQHRELIQALGATVQQSGGVVILPKDFINQLKDYKLETSTDEYGNIIIQTIKEEISEPVATNK
jgi:4-aminobutyrate aminotransferase-like enzyme